MSAATDTHRCLFLRTTRNFTKGMTSLLALAGMAIALSFSGVTWAQPGGGGGATCSIDTVPSPPGITAGGTVDFTGNINGGQKTFSWTFDGGSPAASTAQNVTVAYANPARSLPP